MSKSIHVTNNDFKGLTKAQIDEQSIDPNSNLALWSKKSMIKKGVKKKRKVNKS